MSNVHTFLSLWLTCGLGTWTLGYLTSRPDRWVSTRGKANGRREWFFILLPVCLILGPFQLMLFAAWCAARSRRW